MDNNCLLNGYILGLAIQRMELSLEAVYKSPVLLHSTIEVMHVSCTGNV